VLNTHTHDITFIAIPSVEIYAHFGTIDRVMGVVFGSDGKLYLIPGTICVIMVLDPTTNTVSVAADLRAYLPADFYEMWYSHALLSENGIIYFAP